MRLLKAQLSFTGLVGVYLNGPPVTAQTHRVRMNLRPGNLSKFFVCHSLRAGFFDVFPTIGFCTTASLKWSTTAAMAKTPPSRSYRLFSVSGAACTGVATRRAARAIAIASGLMNEVCVFMILFLLFCLVLPAVVSSGFAALRPRAAWGVAPERLTPESVEAENLLAFASICCALWLIASSYPTYVCDHRGKRTVTGAVKYIQP